MAEGDEAAVVAGAALATAEAAQDEAALARAWREEHERWDREEHEAFSRRLAALEEEISSLKTKVETLLSELAEEEIEEVDEAEEAEATVVAPAGPEAKPQKTEERKRRPGIFF
jgi:ribosomal protein L12E/L44/L45/RPP1/RPP2